MTSDKIPRPPKGLSKRARELWQSLHHDYELSDDLRLLLQTGLEAYDRMCECEAAIGHDLLLTDPSGRQRANPLIEAAKVYRSQFLQSWRLLGVGAEPPKEVGRPPRGY